MPKPFFRRLGGSSWVIVHGVAITITHIGGLISGLISTHGPPSRARNRKGQRMLRSAVPVKQGYLGHCPLHEALANILMKGYRDGSVAGLGVSPQP